MIYIMDLVNPIVYRGVNPAKHLLMALINEKKKILKATDKLSLFSTSKNF